MVINRKLLMAAVCTTVALAVSGCSTGGDGKAKGTGDSKVRESASPTPVDPFAGLTADQIADKSLDITKAADSLKATGTDTADKEPLTFDLAISKTGDCDGVMSSEGTEANLRQVSKVFYMKGDSKFWEQMGEEDGSSAEEITAMVELLKGRWLKIPAAEAADDEMGAMCDVDALLEPADSVGTGLTKGSDTEVNGRPAVVLTKKNGAETTTLYVSAKGQPYLLKFTIEGGKEPKSAVFTDFDKPVTVTAPPADQIVDLEKLGG